MDDHNGLWNDLWTVELSIQRDFRTQGIHLSWTHVQTILYSTVHILVCRVEPQHFPPKSDLPMDDTRKCPPTIFNQLLFSLFSLF